METVITLQEAGKMYRRIQRNKRADLSKIKRKRFYCEDKGAIVSVAYCLWTCKKLKNCSIVDERR